MKRRQITIAVAILLIANLLILQSPPLVSALPSGGRSLYVSNNANTQEPPGQGSNVARFTFDRSGLLSPAETVPTCGTRGPVFSPDVRFAYGACSFAKQIRAYGVAHNGALTSIGQVDFPGANNVAIAPDGRTLYAVSFTNGTLAAFRVGSDGLLALLNSTDSGAPMPKGIGVTPDGRFVYVSHGGPMDTADSVLTGFALGADGTLQGQVMVVVN
jgi:6-phosphogluconolactonase